MTDKFYREHPECHQKCPVKGCNGFYTTTDSPNLLNHIKGFAKSELFKRELFGDTDTPHLTYLKLHYKIAKKESNILIIK